MNEKKRQAFLSRLLAWGETNRRSFPWRGERDPFRILVAEILLQRSRGKTVTTVYSDLFSRWPTAQALSGAPITQLTSTIQPLGLVRRAVTIKALAEEVRRLGEVPRSVPNLMNLPGVGRYAATATAAAAFGADEPSVDAVSARVYRRFFGLPADSEPSGDSSLWEAVRRASRGSPIRELNWAALDLAATICLPKVPRCGSCPLRRSCTWANPVMSEATSTLGASAGR